MAVPVLYYAFNRPQRVQATLEALRRQTVKPPLIVAYADGPRSAGDVASVAEVRRQLRRVDWTTVELVERPHNLGCAANLVIGLNQAATTHREFVVVEDDVQVDVRWYEALCLMLAHYAGCDNVFSVGGYPSVNNRALANCQYDTVASPRFSCWGWGTWANKWRAIQGEMLGNSKPWNAHTIPNIAGVDIAHMLLIYQATDIWDVSVAAACLHRGWQHMLTSYYLVQNLGCDYLTHIESRLPVRFAPATADDHVASLVRQHVSR